MNPINTRRSIAVIGSGVAGLVAAHELAKRNDVTLFEADPRLGGHAHTHRVDGGDGTMVSVDSAFLVHNDRTYPTLCRLFDELGVATRDTEMSMSVRHCGSGLQYAGARGLGGLFPTLGNLARPRYLAMLAEVKKFHRAATRLLAAADPWPEPLREFLARHNFSPYFVENFLTPLVAAVWSCPPAAALDYPARYLFTFLGHHGMLTVFGSPVWRTVVGGSVTYVDAIAAGLHEVRTGSLVHDLRRVPDGVRFRAGARTHRFDAAVVATHSDQALALLAEPTARERAALGAIPYSTNHARLHSDESVLPTHRRARASWNYLIDGNDDVAVTYDISRLMGLRTPKRFLVTLSAADRLDPASVLAEMTYHHPLYTTESLAAQQLLLALDDNRIVFAGAYHGWGFHEDGAASGARAAARLQRDADRNTVGAFT
ncbi:MAG: FAD-dependent oxidoreductase [Mycobacterium sp.]